MEINFFFFFLSRLRVIFPGLSLKLTRHLVSASPLARGSFSYAEACLRIYAWGEDKSLRRMNAIVWNINVGHTGSNL